MPKALTIHRTLVPPQDRAKFLERLKAKHVHYTATGCRFWVFEEAAIPGAFVEFAEADSPAELTKAHQGAPEQILDPTRIYTLVELS